MATFERNQWLGTSLLVSSYVPQPHLLRDERIAQQWDIVRNPREMGLVQELEKFWARGEDGKERMTPTFVVVEYRERRRSMLR